MEKNQFATLLTAEEIKEFFRKHFFEVGTTQITKIDSSENGNVAYLTLFGKSAKWDFEIYYDDFGFVLMIICQNERGEKEAAVYENILWLDEVVDLEKNAHKLVGFYVHYRMDYELTSWILYLLSLEKEWKVDYQKQLILRVECEKKKKAANLIKKIKEMELEIEKNKNSYLEICGLLAQLKKRIEDC